MGIRDTYKRYQQVRESEPWRLIFDVVTLLGMPTTVVVIANEISRHASGPLGFLSDLDWQWYTILACTTLLLTAHRLRRGHERVPGRVATRHEVDRVQKELAILTEAVTELRNNKPGGDGQSKDWEATIRTLETRLDEINATVAAKGLPTPTPLVPRLEADAKKVAGTPVVTTSVGPKTVIARGEGGTPPVPPAVHDIAVAKAYAEKGKWKCTRTRSDAGMTFTALRPAGCAERLLSCVVVFRPPGEQIKSSLPFGSALVGPQVLPGKEQRFTFDVPYKQRNDDRFVLTFPGQFPGGRSMIPLPSGSYRYAWVADFGEGDKADIRPVGGDEW